MSAFKKPAFVLVTLIGSFLLLGQPAQAASKSEIKLLKQSLELQQKQIEQLQVSLASQQARLDQYEKQATAPVKETTTAIKLSNAEMAKSSGAGSKPTEAAASNASANTPIASPKANEPEARPQIDALPDAGGVLTPKGHLVYENSLEYTNTSNNVFSFNGIQVAQSVLVGVLNASSDRQQSVMDSSRFRLGLTNRLEADVRVPFVHSHSSTSTTDTTTNTTTRSSISGTGIGDVDAGLAYQLNRGENNWPFFVGNLRFKANNGDGPYDVPVDSNNVIKKMPTGTGFNAVQGSLTAIKVSDPAILFGNLGYVYNIPETVNRTVNTTRIKDVKGGDNINASAGMALSINPDMSFSLGYKHSYVFPITQRAEATDTGIQSKSRTDTLQVGAMLFGVSYKLTPSVGLNFNTEVGATRDAPDVRLGLRVPISLGQVF